MAGVQLFRGREDVKFAESLRVDLALRQWSVDLAAFNVGEHAPLDTNLEQVAVAVVPHGDGVEYQVFMTWIESMLSRGRAPVLLVPEGTELPARVQSSAGGIVFLDTLNYDLMFDDLYRKLTGTFPAWLDVRVRPSLVQSPTGVAWWADDLFVADDRFDHVVRMSPNDSTVVVPGLYEPHHVYLDRRHLVIANKSANEILECDIVDNMAARIETLHHVDGLDLARPHDLQIDGRMSVIADTDNARVVFRSGKSAPWETAQPDQPFSFPCGVCLDETGFWVADSYNHRLLKFDRQGRQLLAYGSHGEGPSEFSFPVGIRRWRDLLFVADESNERLKVLEVIEGADGRTELLPRHGQLGGSRLGQPFGLSVNRNNRLAVTDRKQKCVWLIDLVQFVQMDAAFA